MYGVCLEVTLNAFDFLTSISAVTCKLPPRIPGTSYEPADGRSIFSPDDTVQVLCDDGYFIGSPSETTKVIGCQHSGEWEITPVCEGTVLSDCATQGAICFIHI